jgi:hypothetical protein
MDVREMASRVGAPNYKGNTVRELFWEARILLPLAESEFGRPTLECSDLPKTHRLNRLHGTGQEKDDQSSKSEPVLARKTGVAVVVRSGRASH